MKKLKKFWQNVPRKAKIILNLLLIVLMVFLIYTFVGSPVFSAEQAFRRAEKANLVGPGTILAQLVPESGDYDKVILAETGNGVMVYRYGRGESTNRDIVYREKTDGLALLSIPPVQYTYSPSQRLMDLPIYLFHNCSDAARAELDITLSADFNSEDFEKTYSLSAQREGDGYFSFVIHAQNSDGLGAEGYALHLFRIISGNSMGGWSDIVIPAAVRFYDAAGNLLRQQNLEVRFPNPGI